MIKEPINICLCNTYDLVSWEKEIIKRCVYDNPTMTQEELSDLLGISVRDLIRKFQRYKINYKELRARSLNLELKSA